MASRTEIKSNPAWSTWSTLLFGLTVASNWRSIDPVLT